MLPTYTVVRYPPSYFLAHPHLHFSQPLGTMVILVELRCLYFPPLIFECPGEGF